MTVKQLRIAFGLVEYYQDIKGKHSEGLVSLTDTVVECGHIKMTKKKGTKKNNFHWEPVHQKAFKKIKI